MLPESKIAATLASDSPWRTRWMTLRGGITRSTGALGNRETSLDRVTPGRVIARGDSETPSP